MAVNIKHAITTLVANHPSIHTMAKDSAGSEMCVGDFVELLKPSKYGKYGFITELLMFSKARIRFFEVEPSTGDFKPNSTGVSVIGHKNLKIVMRSSECSA